MDGTLDQVLPDQEAQVQEPVKPMLRRDDKGWLSEIRGIHNKYVTGLNPLYERIKANEEWWRLHNDDEEKKTTEIGADGGFVAKSSWLANVVVSKHADDMDAYPDTNILPREEADQKTAETLSKVIPCVLELTGFRRVWSKWHWRKDRHGAAFLKTYWAPSAHNGLGEIANACVNPLNLAWQPTCTNIQVSPYFFHQEYVDRTVLAAQYPEAADDLTAADRIPEFAAQDESRDLTGVATVVECYYKVAKPTAIPGVSRNVLHLVVYTGDIVLYCSEDDPERRDTGWYEHGLYPYHVDALFPDEDSAFGRGYIDLGKNPQTQIDLLNTAFLKNAMVGALPRWLATNSAKFNIEDLLDLKKPVVKVDGSLDEHVLKQVDHKPLEGNYLNLRDSLIQELRETTSNTEAATGVGSPSTTASGIAALQEASGKVSRSANADSYDVFSDMVRMMIELIRQFYTLPRIFRITGADGGQSFEAFDNTALKPQAMVGADGQSSGLRKPEFDIKVSAQRASPYTRMAQNELALQFYNAGFFDPARAEQAIMTLEMMDFDGKQEIIGKIQKNAAIYNAMLQFAQLAMQFAPPEVQPTVAQMVMQAAGGQAQALGMGGSAPSVTGGESTRITQARQQSQAAAVPAGG